MREWVSLNGRLMPAHQAQVSVFDSGFMQGVGLFETMRVYNGQVFRLERHLDRLVASAEKLGWTVLPIVDELRHNVRQVVAATEQSEAHARLTVTTGTLRAAADVTQLTIVATASAGSKYPPEFYQKGVSVVISKHRQHRSDPTAGHKTTSYFARLASLREAHAARAIEALWFTDDNYLAEGAISSVFLVRDDQLHTPPLDTPILPGITRAAVIEIAVDQGIPMREMRISKDDLLAADEVFLTNSLMEVMPVVRIGREPVGAEKPGDLTEQLYTSYGDLVARECSDE
ncbi:MAG: aminotransferase class IV [Planctomycetes bacterium]|nr:aminotransferase class IV [Planctomycetota bacterium]